MYQLSTFKKCLEFYVSDVFIEQYTRTFGLDGEYLEMAKEATVSMKMVDIISPTKAFSLIYSNN